MKKKIVKSASVFLLIFALLFVSMFSAGAISYTNDVDTKSDSILLVNMDTNQVVFEKDPDSRRYPASTTKIMTYIIAIENIPDYENTRIEIKEDVLRILDGTGSSTANLENHIGDKLTALDLLYAMMVPSGNDAAVVLADYVGNGDISKFVDLMNQKAQELGCEDTHFQNPDGLHNADHYTTARDLYKITSYALTKPMFSEITNTTTYYIEGDDYPLITTNYLIDAGRGGEYYYQYAKGIKTGTTDQAGHCLVTTGSADGYSYMAVLLHSPYEEMDDEYGTMYDAADLFRWALVKLQLTEIKTADMPVCEVGLRLAWNKDKILLTPAENITAITPKEYDPSWITIETDVPDHIDAPVKQGDVIGSARVYYKDDTMTEKQLLSTAQLVASESVDQSGFLYVLDVMKNIVCSMWFLIAMAVIVILVIIYLIVSKASKRRNRKKKRVKRYRNL
ncbi:MAG: D-alanyl-D-alanine carboxypeptidase [bacterium]|nr:D-alanyl-D-alanine carboxypeptidase [bacterium]MDD6225206.1 D-alanyl-D-alanine carboxypeptidase [bacterium]